MSAIDKPPTEPVIKNMTDGRYELHCKRFQAAHKHDGRETAVSERAN